MDEVGGSQLGDGVGAHLNLESDEAFGDCGDRSGNSTGSVGGACAFSDTFDDGVKVRAGPHGGIDGQDAGVGETVRLPQPAHQRFLSEAHHLVNDFSGRVVRPGLLAQLRVVQVEEVLVEVKVRVAFTFPDAVPMDGTNDAHEEVEGDLEVRSHVIGEELQRLAHEGVVVPELTADYVQADPGQVDVLRPGEEQ